MRDLVETVITQVMKQDPQPIPAKRQASAHTTGIHKFTLPMDRATSNEKHVQTHLCRHTGMNACGRPAANLKQ